jgi:broad specificity phosphatase PhoE
MKKEIIQKWPSYLVLVRHGQSLYNEERELVNRGVLKTYLKSKELRDVDIPLSAKGRKQAQTTANFLKKNYNNFDLIFASPAERAYRTAKLISRKFPKSRFIVEERIREREFGITDGLTKKEIMDLFPYEYERRKKMKKYYYRPSGGESFPDVNLRIWSFLTTLVREYSKMNILVASHAVVLMCFRKLLEKLSEAQILKIDKEDEIKNCGIISYRFDPKIRPKPKLNLEFYNKVAWKK